MDSSRGRSGQLQQTPAQTELYAAERGVSAALAVCVAHVVPDRAAHVSGQALSRQRLARGSGRVALRSDAQRALGHVGKTRPCT